MSGGSWDYFYNQLEDVASRLQGSEDMIRRAFGAHLSACAKALHDIEWVDSCDYGTGDEIDAIEKALGKYKHTLVLEEARKAATKALADLQAVLADCPNTACSQPGKQATE